MSNQRLDSKGVNEILTKCNDPLFSSDTTPSTHSDNLICTISKMPEFDNLLDESEKVSFITIFYNYIISHYDKILNELTTMNEAELLVKLHDIFYIGQTSKKGFDGTLTPHEMELLHNANGNNSSSLFSYIPGGKRKNKLTKNKKFKIKSKKELGKIIRRGKKSIKRKYKRKSKKRKSKKKSKKKSIRRG